MFIIERLSLFEQLLCHIKEKGLTQQVTFGLKKLALVFHSDCLITWVGLDKGKTFFKFLKALLLISRADEVL
jgi:hypothetical protein